MWPNLVKVQIKNGQSETWPKSTTAPEKWSNLCPSRPHLDHIGSTLAKIWPTSGELGCIGCLESDQRAGRQIRPTLAQIWQALVQFGPNRTRYNIGRAARARGRNFAKQLLVAPPKILQTIARRNVIPNTTCDNTWGSTGRIPHARDNTGTIPGRSRGKTNKIPGQYRTMRHMFVTIPAHRLNNAAHVRSLQYPNIAFGLVLEGLSY